MPERSNHSVKSIGDWIEDLGAASDALADTIMEAKGVRSEVERQLTDSQEALSISGSDVDILEQVTTLLQGLEEAWQRKFQEAVAEVISRGLSIVFEEPIKLVLVPKVRADVTTVDLRIIQGEGKDALETGVMGAKGGTLIAILNVLLRALLILSARPPLRRILLLDEPFGLADDSYTPVFGELLRELVDKLGFQIIVNSHEQALVDAADCAYEVYRDRKAGARFRRLRSRREERV